MLVQKRNHLPEPFTKSAFYFVSYHCFTNFFAHGKSNFQIKFCWCKNKYKFIICIGFAMLMYIFKGF